MKPYMCVNKIIYINKLTFYTISKKTFNIVLLGLSYQFLDKNYQSLIMIGFICLNCRYELELES